MNIPSALLDRLDGSAQDDLPRLFANLRKAYSTQYEIESRTFSEEEFDDSYTFGWGCRQRGFGRAAEAVEDLASVVAHASGLKQSFSIGPFTIRPYRFGALRPADIHLERLDPNSLTKEFVGVDNATQLQEAFDLRSALNPPPLENALCSSNQLVLALFGNARDGQTGIYIGAPLSEMVDGSYWEWVIELDDAEAVAAGTSQADNPSADGGTTAFDQTPEPELPMRPRREDERDSRQGS